MAVPAPDYLSEGLIASCRNKYITPNTQSLFQDADILSILDECQRSYIIPIVSSVREEYWVQFDDQAVTGAASYTIPQRAAGAILRDVVYVDSAGNEIELQQLNPTQIKASFPYGRQLPLYTFGYYMKNDQFVPYPQQAQQATGYTLRFKPLRRPNNLTLASNCGQVTNIAGSVISLSYIDPQWGTSTEFDIIQNFPQFSSIADSATITAIGASSVTLTTVPSDLAVGMWFAPKLMSPIPQIPYEMFSILVQVTIKTMAESIGDSQASGLFDKTLKEMKKDFVDLIDPRIQGGSKKIINKNAPSNWGNIGGPFLR